MVIFHIYTCMLLFAVDINKVINIVFHRVINNHKMKIFYTLRYVEIKYFSIFAFIL